MKAILYYTIILIALSSCRKKTVIEQNVLNSTNIILRTESILKKIPSSNKYEDSYPTYYTNGKKIFLSYGDFDNNYYRIDTLQTIKYLTENELAELKQNIYKLSKVGLNDQDCMIYDPDILKGFYIYRYKYEDWMADEPQLIPYVTLAKNVDMNNQWFKNKFKIVSQKGSLVILTVN